MGIFYKSSVERAKTSSHYIIIFVAAVQQFFVNWKYNGQIKKINKKRCSEDSLGVKDFV